MMKTKFKDREGPRNPMSMSKMKTVITQASEVEDTGGNSSGIFWGNPVETEPLSLKNQELMTRLASGMKGKVDKKAMKRLTVKNYEKLPEIIKKKEEAKQKEELAAKKARCAAY